MKTSKLMGDRFKERPADATLESHALLIRGGYIKQVSNGIFSLLPPAKRIVNKIEALVREEMNAIDGQEVLFPVVMPASLWQESGRYESIGPEMARFKDRSDSPMLLGMTHEEAAVHMCREYGNSYARYPFMIYQIQTKFRDEARPRGGLIRVREFTMKDGYSFHTTREDLQDYYQKVHRSYERIFARAGLPDVVSVKADSGMMGGSVSHEFMLLTEAGEDSIILCHACGYSANMEAAASVVKNGETAVEELKEHHTPSLKTIDDIATFFNIPANQTAKAVVYEKESDGKLVVVFIRGDLEVNECKLRNHLGSQVKAAGAEKTDKQVCAGFIGPLGLSEEVDVLYDNSLEGLSSLVVGANKKDYHLKGFNMSREMGSVSYHDLAKAIDGGICPQCGKPSLTVSRGIEVGNIFQLDTKYSKVMGMDFTDEHGENHPAIMGCYGIGIGRLLGSVCEAYHDDYGPLWPISIAPWTVQLCALNSNSDEQVKAVADQLYESLQAKGVDVLYDDRAVRPGVMFADADLISCPVRVIISPKGLANGEIELMSRDKSIKKVVSPATIGEEVTALCDELRAQINNKL